MPDGISIQEVEDAGGLVLVDASGITLYAFQGHGSARAIADKVVALADQNQWKPLVAPDLAHPFGQWSIVARSDGIQQWAFRGKPLFTFAGDLISGDANGVDLSADWDAALVARVYRPADVRVVQTLGRGRVLATVAGLTLYRHDGVGLASAGGQSLRHGVPYRPGIGRNVGTSGCDAECLKMWHPFVAPADAQPHGFWDVALRTDGTRQWVYQGYALYTYAGDQKPGDINGNDIFSMDLTLSDGPTERHSVGTPMHGTAGLDWTVAYP
jgi:predicted lipoprotein with Yx(FWY)xxD motif